MRLEGALCYKHPTPDIWTDAGGRGVDLGVTAYAKRLCERECPAREECEAGAKVLLRGDKDLRGVWGGKTVGTLRKEIKRESNNQTSGGSSHRVREESL